MTLSTQQSRPADAGAEARTHPGTPASAVTTEPYFEDYRIGETLHSAPVTFDRDTAAAYLDAVGGRIALHDPDVEGSTAYGPHIIAAFMDWVVRSGMARHIVAEMSHTWHYSHPVPLGGTVTFALTPTRALRTPGGSRGIIDRAIEVLGEDGTVLQTATSRVLVEARECKSPADGAVGLALGSPAWLERLRAELDADERFRTCTATWDGSLGLAFGEGDEAAVDAVQLRVYKGTIIDAGRRTPNGPTFTLSLSDKNWAGLVTGPHNDLTERAMRGQTRVSGDAYEYIRHTRTVQVVVDAMRSIAREALQ